MGAPLGAPQQCPLRCLQQAAAGRPQIAISNKSCDEGEHLKGPASLPGIQSGLIAGRLEFA